MKVKAQLLNEMAKLPTQGSILSAGWDLYACLFDDVTIHPHETKLIPTGLAIVPPKSHFGAIFARSGIATKEGLRPANCVGVCDEDYRGEYKVALHNDSEYDRHIKNGDKIAQLVFIKYNRKLKWKQCESLDTTKRGENGFGSTGG